MTAAETIRQYIYLVRYGTVPEVARFANDSAERPAHGSENVVVETDRGLQIGTVLERLKPNFDPAKDSETEFKVIRAATDLDLGNLACENLVRECETAFPEWCARISQWGLESRTCRSRMDARSPEVDSMSQCWCERGPDSTKLALQAEAAGQIRCDRSPTRFVIGIGHDPAIVVR